MSIPRSPSLPAPLRLPDSAARRGSALLQRTPVSQPELRQLFVHVADRPFVVRYSVARSHRRTIGFQIDGRGLSIRAPVWVGMADIEGAIRTKASWILDKQDEWQRHVESRRAIAPRYVDGGQIMWLGRPLPLRLVEAQAPPGADLTLRADALQIVHPRCADPAWVERRVQTWIKEQARALYAQRLEHYARLLGRAPSSWALSSATSRWGSCNSAGRILLSWRLMHFPPHLIDYVVAHELAHLVELNHSPRFWAVVEHLLPGHRQARRELKLFPDATPRD